MGFITNAGENYLLELVCSRTPALPAYYVALVANSQPSQFIAGHELDEPNAGDYARARYVNQPLGWTTATGEVSNTLQVAFPIAQSRWGTLRHWAVCTEEQGGSVLWAGTLETPLEIHEEDQVVLPPGSLTIRAASYSSRVSL